MNEVYKILIPIAEAHRDFKKLANIHKYGIFKQFVSRKIFTLYLFF